MVENNVSGKFISAVHNARKSQEKEDMIVYQTVIPNLPFGETPRTGRLEARPDSCRLPPQARGVNNYRKRHGMLCFFSRFYVSFSGGPRKLTWTPKKIDGLNRNFLFQGVCFQVPCMFFF